jgi:hypothetical protein
MDSTVCSLMRDERNLSSSLIKVSYANLKTILYIIDKFIHLANISALSRLRDSVRTSSKSPCIELLNANMSEGDIVMVLRIG